jgi:hypothetical protein
MNLTDLQFTPARENSAVQRVRAPGRAKGSATRDDDIHSIGELASLLLFSL